MNLTLIEDISFDKEPLGLTEELNDIMTPFKCIISCDDFAEVGDIIYFAIDLPIGELAEIRGIVLSIASVNSKNHITVEIRAIDKRFPNEALKVLQGKIDTTPSGGKSPQWAIGMKQTNGTYATLVNSPAGLLTASQLTKLAEVATKGAGLVKLTHAQRMILLLKAEQLETVEEDLKLVDLKIGVLHKGVRNIRGCCGSLCKWAQNVDGLGLALKIDKALYGRPMQFDVKIAVSDCLRNCMESFCVDIGLLGDKDRYKILVGGSAATSHLRAMKVIDGIKEDDTIDYIKRILDWYENHALDNERLHKTLERIGIETQIKSPDFSLITDHFKEFNLGEDTGKFLTGKYYRSLGLQKLRKDLNIEVS